MSSVARETEKLTKEDLEEALRAIGSTISKCEKILPKLTRGGSQHTLLARRIKALQVASVLITRELGLSSAEPSGRRKGSRAAVKRRSPARQ